MNLNGCLCISIYQFVYPLSMYTIPLSPLGRWQGVRSLESTSPTKKQKHILNIIQNVACRTCRICMFLGVPEGTHTAQRAALLCSALCCLAFSMLVLLNSIKHCGRNLLAFLPASAFPGLPFPQDGVGGKWLWLVLGSVHGHHRSFFTIYTI